jgi:hypothetical protein
MSLISASRSRNRIALVMAVTILLAGIAQAAHYEKSELAGGRPDVHCLVCLYAGGAAGPPAIAQVLQALPSSCSYTFPSNTVPPPSHCVAPYEARGPPLS